MEDEAIEVGRKIGEAVGMGGLGSGEWRASRGAMTGTLGREAWGWA